MEVHGRQMEDALKTRRIVSGNIDERSPEIASQARLMPGDVPDNAEHHPQILENNSHGWPAAAVGNGQRPRDKANPLEIGRGTIYRLDDGPEIHQDIATRPQCDEVQTGRTLIAATQVQRQ